MTSNQYVSIQMKMIAFHIISSTITGRWVGRGELGWTHSKQTNEQTTKLAADYKTISPFGLIRREWWGWVTPGDLQEVTTQTCAGRIL